MKPFPEAPQRPFRRRSGWISQNERHVGARNRCRFADAFPAEAALHRTMHPQRLFGANSSAQTVGK
jgi:hypothetical protein